MEANWESRELATGDWRRATGNSGHHQAGNMPQIDELKMQPSMPGPSVKLAAVLA